MLCVVHSHVNMSCPTLCNQMDHSLPGSSVHGDSPGKNTGVGCMPSSRGSSQQSLNSQGQALSQNWTPGLLTPKIELLVTYVQLSNKRGLFCTRSILLIWSFGLDNTCIALCIAGWLAYLYHSSQSPLVAQLVKSLPAMGETQVQSWGQEDPLEKEMASYSSILDGRIPWTDESGGLQSMGSQRVRHN